MSYKLDEITQIEEWLSHRPSGCLDPFVELIPAKLDRLRELKSTRRLKDRLPSKMMQSQQMSEVNE